MGSSYAGARTSEGHHLFPVPSQLTVLIVLANYAREGNEHVIILVATGRQSGGISPYWGGMRMPPRAVVGLNDLSARLYVQRQLGNAHLTTFVVPYRMFLEMESHLEGAFLGRPTWRRLMAESVRGRSGHSHHG